VKHLSQGVKVGILVLVMVVASYATWKTVGEQASGDSSFSLFTRFRDASGLPAGSRVVIAGLPVGEISRLGIENRYARVTMRLRDLVIWDNAIAMKKSSSLLGDYYIEIDPGTEFSIDVDGARVQNHRLKHGDEIKRVIEATSPDQLLRRVEESMPKVDQVLVSVRDLSEDVRALVNGPISSMANRLDRLVQDESQTVSQILARLDDSLARIQDITKDVKDVTDGADAKVNSILDRTEELMVSARKEVEDTGNVVREKLELVDEVLERSASVVTKVDQNKGTLGRLVNDSTLADNLEDLTGDARNFVRTLFGMQTFVGLRSEYNVFARAANNYVTVEFRTRPDKYYLVEFNRGPRGKYPATELVVDPIPNDSMDTEFRRRVTIRDGTRVTFQFAKRIDWLTMRFGVKESSGGVGLDGQFFDGRLKLSVDAFDMAVLDYPRVKVAAAYSLFSHLYIMGGVDDVLNTPFTIQVDELESGLPRQFEQVRFGRDFFLGGYIQFNDLDLTALLTIGSGLLLAAAE
jgi:phospholipid/cholesterol/gamma-HCH transport system substrate-binding protein